MSTEFTSSLENCFGDLPDPRASGRYDHKLLDIIIIAVCGVLCGQVCTKDAYQVWQASLNSV